MRYFIVIPTYNERDTIKQLLTDIFSHTARHQKDVSVVVVDDNSPDHTARIVTSLQRQLPFRHKLFLLQRSHKSGLGSALIAGFLFSLKHGADVIFEMDADGSHDPYDTVRMIASLTAHNADVVIGSRRVPGGRIIGWNIWRHISSWGAMSLSRLLLKLKTKDVTNGFRCYRRHVLESINLNTIKSNGYAFQEEIIWRCERSDFRIIEIPVVFRDREFGTSKLSWKEIKEFFSVIIQLCLLKH